MPQPKAEKHAIRVVGEVMTDEQTARALEDDLMDFLNDWTHKRGLTEFHHQVLVRNVDRLKHLTMLYPRWL